MDERKFIRSRIEINSISPSIVVLGSSRIMQINSKSIGKDILNLGMSGSSVEDDVAVWSLASRNMNPESVLIGADPWLFNAHSGQDRWKSLDVEYVTALNEFGFNFYNSIPSHKSINENVGNLASFYRYVNIASIKATNDKPDHMDKIRKDGSRVYNLKYANQSELEIQKGILSYASYAMSPYEHSVISENIFKHLVSHISKRHKVVLILSPYHPKLYSFMFDQDKKFIDIEKKFRMLGTSLGVEVVGSYDPTVVGCSSYEFFDGMHPKESCMKKIIDLIR